MVDNMVVKQGPGKHGEKAGFWAKNAGCPDRRKTLWSRGDRKRPLGPAGDRENRAESMVGRKLRKWGYDRHIPKRQILPGKMRESSYYGKSAKKGDLAWREKSMKNEQSKAKKQAVKWPKYQVKSKRLVGRKKIMSKEAICEICGGGKAFIQWTPFETILMFSDIRYGQMKMESIRICERCRSYVMKIFRPVPEAFGGCQTLVDIIQVVRQEIGS